MEQEAPLPIPTGPVKSIAELLEENPLNWTDGDLASLVAHWRAKRNAFNASKLAEAQGAKKRTVTRKPKLDEELAALEIDLNL